MHFFALCFILHCLTSIRYVIRSNRDELETASNKTNQAKHKEDEQREEQEKLDLINNLNTCKKVSTQNNKMEAFLELQHEQEHERLDTMLHIDNEHQTSHSQLNENKQDLSTLSSSTSTASDNSTPMSPVQLQDQLEKHDYHPDLFVLTNKRMHVDLNANNINKLSLDEQENRYLRPSSSSLIKRWKKGFFLIDF